MSNPTQPSRVLAIDPTSRGIAYVVMEGPHCLIDWGVKSVRPVRQDRCLAGVKAQIEFFAPTVIVLEDTAKLDSRRCGRVRRLIKAVRILATKVKVRTCLVSNGAVRTAFAATNASTKHQIAVAIASLLPELADRLPRYRRPWMSEDYRTNIFDAVALALTYFRLREKRRPACSHEPL